MDVDNYVDLDQFVQGPSRSYDPNEYVNMDEFAPLVEPPEDEIKRERVEQQKEAAGDKEGSSLDDSILADPLGFIRSDDTGKPSFLRDVVAETIADVARLPYAFGRGLASSPRGFLSAAEGFSNAWREAAEERIEDYKDPDYIPPLAKKLYPISEDMSPEQKDTARQKQKDYAAYWRRVYEARGGIAADKERIDTLTESAARAERWKKKFPGRYKEIKNLAEAAVYSLGEFAPGMLATLGTGGIGGFVTNYVQIHGVLYEQYQREGAPKDKAQEAAMTAAAFSSLFETTGKVLTFKSIGKIMGKMLPKVGVGAKTSNRIRDILSDIKSAAAPGAIGTLEEFLQQYPEEFGRIAATAPEEATNEDIINQFLERIGSEEFRAEQRQAAAAGGLAGTIMWTVPASGRSVSQRRKTRTEQISKKTEAEARAARTKLQDAYQRKPGDQGLQSVHPLAQQNIDLYNLLLQLYKEGEDAKKAEKKEIEEGTAEKETGPAVEEEIVEETASAIYDEEVPVDEPLDKIRPKGREPRTSAKATVEKAPTFEKDPFRDAFNRADESGEGRYVFIHKIREESGLPKEEFDQLFYEKIKDGTIAAHPGNPGALTDAEVEGTFVDDFGDRYVTASWRGRPEQDQELTAGQRQPPSGEDVILTKQGKPFKSRAGAKSARTRQGLADTHEIIEVEEGYALRPISREGALPKEPSIFEDIDLLESELRKAENEESTADIEELARALESVQERTLTYLSELDNADQKAVFIADNTNLTRQENDRLLEIFQKEDAGILTPEDAADRTALLRKLVGKEQKNRVDLNREAALPAQEGEEDIFSLPSFFNADPKAVKTIQQTFEQRTMEQIKSNPDTLLGYLINQINAWVHGISEPDLHRIRQALNHLRDESNNWYDYFGSQVRLNEFVEAVDGAIELAEKAATLRSKGSNPNILRSSFGLEVFYPAIRDIIATIQRFRGRMRAKEALNKLKKTKGVKAADLEYSGLDRFLNKAMMERRKVTKEELLDAVTNLPKVEVEIRSTDPDPSSEALRRLIRIARDPRYYNSKLVERLAKTLNVSREFADLYLNGEISLAEFVKQIELKEPPSYDEHSFFRQLPNSSYEHDEILITLPEYGPDPIDMHHSAFGKSVAFFGAASRNHEKFVVEEIQSELDTMKGQGLPDVPAPYKTDAWPNLIASILIKRAKNLGYDEILFPSYEWVNERWEGHLPKSVKPVYNSIFPKAMEKLGAKRLTDEVVEDAKLFHRDAGLVSIAAGRILGRYNVLKSNSLFPSFSDLVDYINNSLANLSEEIIDDIKRTVVERVSSRTLSDLDNGRLSTPQQWSDVLPILVEVAKYNEDIPKTELTVAAMGIYQNEMVKNLSSLGASTAEIAEARDAFNKMMDGEIQPEEFEKLADRLDDKYTFLPDIPFQRYRLPKEEPAPKSVPLTCKCGIDPTDIIRLVKRWAKNRGQKPKRAGKGAEVANMYDDVSKETEKSLSKQAGEIKSLLGAGLLDVTRPMKQKLVKAFGEVAANKAITRIILAKGFSVRASMFLNRAVKDVYGGLSKRKRDILDRVIFSSRLIQIGRYRGNVKDFKGKTPQQHRDYLYNLEEQENITENEALELFRRAERYFDYTLELLTELKDEGLITQEEFEDLKTFRWTRTEALHKVDPAVSEGAISLGSTYYQRWKKVASVRESGIEELQTGSELDSPQIDMMYVLADWTNRVMKRVSLARMNKQVWELANSDPKNKLIRPSKGNKRPPNWQTIEMLVEGKKRKIYAPPEFARWWTLDIIGMKPFVANMIRVLSGSFILRPMATGIRLGFIPVNILRDIGLIWTATKYLDRSGKWKPVYNRLMPLAGTQMLWDLGRVIPAALLKSKHKRYRDYVHAGGGLSFMAVQGRPFEAAEMKTRFGSGSSYVWAKLKSHGDKLMDVLSYPLEVSEIMTRLMAVERSLIKIAQREGVSVGEARNNKDMYAEAAGIARDYLDFGQYGTAIKVLDQARPYLNATFQAGRSYFRAWRKDPITALIQSSQVMLIGALLALGRQNYMEDDDEEKRNIEKDISPYDLARYFITFPYGKLFYFTDAYGNRHRPYIKVPIEGPMILSKLAGELAVARITGQDIRGDVIREAVKAAIPFQAVPTDVPIFDAYLRYFHNLDSFFGGKVWPYDEYVKAEERITADTPEMIVDFAEFFNKWLPEGGKISPHNLAEALKSIGTEGNYLTHAMGAAYDQLSGVPEADREVILWKALAEHPTTGGIINFTRPDIARYEEIEDSEKEVVTEQVSNKLKIMERAKELREIQKGMIEGNARRKELEILGKIKKLAGDDEKEYNRLTDVYRFYTEMPSTPRWSQWESLIGKAPETRAKMFKRILEQTPPAKQSEVWAEVKMFPQMDSKEFWEAYNGLLD